jgi:hypothetical protein
VLVYGQEDARGTKATTDQGGSDDRLQPGEVRQSGPLHHFPVPGPDEVGGVRLRKILYFSDALQYLHTGQPITGATYVKQQYGPVPKQLNAALERLESWGALKVKREPHPYGYPMDLYYALGEPDLSLFTPEEISRVDRLIDKICNNFSAERISTASHHEAWEAGDIGEELPYHTVFVAKSGEITEDAVACARERIERYERSSRARV